MCAPRVCVHVTIRGEVHLVPHEEVVESRLELGGVAVLTLPVSKHVLSSVGTFSEPACKVLICSPHNREELRSRPALQ